MKRLALVTNVALAVLLGMICEAVEALVIAPPPIWSWGFSNPPATVGPTDVVTIHATVSNAANSPQSLILQPVSAGAGFLNLGTQTQYNFQFGSYGFGSQPIIPGQSVNFTFGTLTPSTGTVPPGQYGLRVGQFGSARVGVGYLFSTNSFLFSVAAPPPTPNCQDITSGAIHGTNGVGLGPSLSQRNTRIDATFVPNGGRTLHEAETICGFTAFDWIQTFTHAPDPIPWQEVNTSDPSSPIQMTNAMVPFNDPPRGGYTYCLDPTFNGGIGCNDYPFYYSVNDSGTWHSLDNYELPIGSTNPTMLAFYDAPADPCLSLVQAVRNPQFCHFNLSAIGDYLGVRTDLAGILPNGTPLDLQIGFSWTDRFNGFSGGISTTLNNLPVDLNSGTGGITITEIRETAPEPGTITMFTLALCLMLVRCQRSKRSVFVDRSIRHTAVALSSTT